MMRNRRSNLGAGEFGRYIDPDGEPLGFGPYIDPAGRPLAFGPFIDPQG